MKAYLQLAFVNLLDFFIKELLMPKLALLVGGRREAKDDFAKLMERFASVLYVSV